MTAPKQPVSIFLLLPHLDAAEMEEELEMQESAKYASESEVLTFLTLASDPCGATGVEGWISSCSRKSFSEIHFHFHEITCTHLNAMRLSLL